MAIEELQSRSHNAQKWVCAACTHRFCDHLPEQDRFQLQSFRELVRGDRLDLDGHAYGRLWIIVEGTVAVCMLLADGRRQILDLQTQDDVICGAIAGPRNASSVEVLDACRVCEITFHDAPSEMPQGRFLETKIRRLFHHQLVRMSSHSVALGRLDSMERICWFLVEMARRLGTVKERSVRVSLPLSREDIADYLGLNTETISRLCSRVKKNGLAIFISPTEYVVPDLEALERRVPFALTSSFQSEPRKGKLPSMP